MIISRLSEAAIKIIHLESHWKFCLLSKKKVLVDSMSEEIIDSLKESLYSREILYFLTNFFTSSVFVFRGVLVIFLN